MTTENLVDSHVLWGQNCVVSELMGTDESIWNRIENPEELDDILEWWLVTPILARMLKKHGEVILSDYDCHWWGRQISGQSIYMDHVMRQIADEIGA